MNRFKDRLWGELMREHGADLAQMRRQVAKHSRRPRPRVLVGSTLGLAGVGTALALVLSAASSSPAFAVTRNHDGTVTVMIKRIDGISGANALLTALGVRARAVQVVAGCTIAPRLALPSARLITVQRGARGVPAGMGPVIQARFDPRRIPPGRTLVLPTLRVGHLIHIAPANWVHGAAPACLPPALPIPGRGCLLSTHAGGNSGNSGNSGPAPTTAVNGKSANHLIPVPPGNSGNSGNSATGTTGGARLVQVPANCHTWKRVTVKPGNSGNS